MKKRQTSAFPEKCRGLTQSAYRKLPKREKRHFMRCPKCRRYFDMRRLDQAVAHSLLDHDACTPAAQQFSGIRGRPVRIRKFKVIPIGQKKAIDGAEFDRMRRASARSHRPQYAKD